MVAARLGTRPARVSGVNMKARWLLEGGLFRWLARGIMASSLALLLLLHYLAGLHLILAALAGFSVLLVGLLVLYVLVVTGRIDVS